MKNTLRCWTLVVFMSAIALGTACDDDAACPTPQPSTPCVYPVVGTGQCGDSATLQQCLEQQWVCPAGTIPGELCPAMDGGTND